ncbi:tripartite tricarboxylate transporter substrate binding protein [Achromobacter sp. Bel]|uniref:Bug family tripartite tricarboxylate transporter substrate binding protein n=1 Tax=Achromobacter sp. Bel TaxID=2727415 RepID=UPI00145D0A17|nr:tripartite tricarboxylate transporter substrate binding protein [Achromobacter sp. Bel]NMK48222.1 tripartite tricarboxylate transporter substrate binding protein [Achromobacter sp. Bel]
MNETTQCFSSQRRRILNTLAGAALLACGGAPALAGAFPQKPIRLIVAFSPGGPTDVLARLVAKRLGDGLGQQVVVENKPGAGGNIAAEMVANAPADGYTLLYNSSSIAISPALFANDKLDPGKIFTPVASVANVPLVLIVNPQVSANTAVEFVTLLKEKPGKLNMGSSGNGTIDHLTSILFARQTATDFAHVPYKGNAAALPDLLSGRIEFMLSGSLNAFLPYVKEGKLKALAVTTAKRVSVLPEVPTLAETVAPGFDSGTWQGIVGPAGMPTDVTAKLNQAVNDAIKDPSLKASLDAQGAEATPGTPAQYGDLIKSEYRRWSAIIKETGATSN